MSVADCYVSVVAPLQDDADIVEDFVRETMAVLERSFTNYELVLIDDGSTDDTMQRVSRLLSEHECVRVLRLSRHFGEEIAISAGLAWRELAVWWHERPARGWRRVAPLAMAGAGALAAASHDG